MKNYFAPIFSLILTACVENSPVKDENVFVNKCDTSAFRARYSAAVQKAIEIPICIHTVYPDEVTRASLEVEGTQEVESTDEAYTRIYVEYFNTFMAAVYHPLTGEQIRLDTKIWVYEFAPRDIIVDAEWGNVNAYSDSDPAGLTVRHDLAVSNNTEGCENLYIIKNDVLSPDKLFGYATFPDNAPQDNYILLWDTDEGDTDSSKIAHEFGHVLDLSHTDATGGDHVDDTPYDPGEDYCDIEADPNTGEVFGTCDAPYEEYGPDLPLDNIMASYARRYVFTVQQIERMHCTWNLYEDNIFPHYYY